MADQKHGLEMCCSTEGATDLKEKYDLVERGKCRIQDALNYVGRRGEAGES
jgi:hypothetical protein